MNRILAGVAALALAGSLTACGGGDNGPSDDDIAAAASNGNAASAFEWIPSSFPSDVECVTKVLKESRLTTEQLEVIVGGGDPDPHEDEEWDKTREKLEDCK